MNQHLVHLSRGETVFACAVIVYAFVAVPFAFFWALLRERRTAVGWGIIGTICLIAAAAALALFNFANSTWTLLFSGMFLQLNGMRFFFRFTRSPRKEAVAPQR